MEGPHGEGEGILSVGKELLGRGVGFGPRELRGPHGEWEGSLWVIFCFVGLGCRLGRGVGLG